MSVRQSHQDRPIIRTPEHRLRVFVSSTLKELVNEREAARQAILNLRLIPVMFESGARSHPSHELYRAYLAQSHIFVGIYWQSYGWVPEGETISGLEDEFLLSSNIPRLIYIKDAKAEREQALKAMLVRMKSEDTTSYKYFSTAEELRELVENDLALMLTEHFEMARDDEPLSDERGEHPLSNIPVPRNPLLGREKELALAHNLLMDQDVGLVTLTGPGGTGKSRLGLQMALNMLDHFKDGVYLIRLTPVRDPQLVIPTIAETLGVREAAGGKRLIHVLRDYLRGKQMLLLIDNFEQVLEAAPQVSELIEACPSIKFVITSRAPLHVRGEKELFVPPLAMPALRQLPDLQSLSQYAALSLFIQRARDIKPDFNITNDNAPSVAEICYRLDGLPLAIELAAARIRLLTPHELLVRLEHRFDILRGGRDMPERQQTLRSTIDWSYDLLEESAKALFRRLSIFVGGWTLEAAEAVFKLGDGNEVQAMDALDLLVDNNLLTLTQDAESVSRFGMLDTIHEYGRERLKESGELEQIQLQHARYYLDFVSRVEPLIRSSERVRSTLRMRQEFDNIRAVLDWTCSTGQYAEIGQIIFVQLGAFWLTSGYLTEGRQWAKKLLAYALLARGLVADTAGDLASARAMYQEGYDLYMMFGDLWGATLALSWLGTIAYMENDHEGADKLFDQALRTARQQGDPWGMTGPLMTIGLRSMLTNNLDEAYTTYSEARMLFRQVGDKWNLSWALSGLGYIALMQGRLDRARDYFLEDLALAREIDNPGALIIGLVGAGALIASRFRDISEARKPHETDLLIAMKFCGVVIPILQESRPFLWHGWRGLYDKIVSHIHTLVDESQWDSTLAEGTGIPMPQAVDIALQQLKNTTTDPAATA